MTFDELRLLCAIHHLNPGKGDRASDQERLEFGRDVQRTYSELFHTTRFPWDVGQVVAVFLKWRKHPDIQTKAAIALTHGLDCFWRGRDKGPCCDDAEAGHLVPRSEHGPLTVENCIIECRAHNNQRRAMTIEQYLLNEAQTARETP